MRLPGVINTCVMGKVRRNVANVTCVSCAKQLVVCPFPLPKEVEPVKTAILEPEAKSAKAKKGKQPVGKFQGEHLRLILPFKLPTWNQLLAMGPWQRAKVRNWIKERVSECIQSADDSQTQTGSVRRLLLTDSCLAEYYRMIVPDSSKRSRTRKKQGIQKKPSLI